MMHPVCPEARRGNGGEAKKFLQQSKTLASMSPRPFRITPKALPKRSKPYGLVPDFRPTISIRPRISGGTSKNRCYRTAGRSRREGKYSSMRQAEPWPRSYGNGVGASSRSQAISRWRKSRPLQSWKARMRGLCTVSQYYPATGASLRSLIQRNPSEAQTTIAEKRYPRSGRPAS